MPRSLGPRVWPESGPKNELRRFVAFYSFLVALLRSLANKLKGVYTSGNSHSCRNAEQLTANCSAKLLVWAASESLRLSFPEALNSTEPSKAKKSLEPFALNLSLQGFIKYFIHPVVLFVFRLLAIELNIDRVLKISNGYGLHSS